MSREVFPFEPDREIIHAFLLGRTRNLDPETGYLVIHNAMLGFNASQVGSRPTFAWYAPDGTLQAKLASSTATSYSLRTINYMMGVLGEPGRQITRDQFTFENYTSPHDTRYIFDGTYIEVDQPIVLAGPVGILAWRAAQKSACKGTRATK